MGDKRVKGNSGDALPSRDHDVAPDLMSAMHAMYGAQFDEHLDKMKKRADGTYELFIKSCNDTYLALIQSRLDAIRDAEERGVELDEKALRADQHRLMVISFKDLLWRTTEEYEECAGDAKVRLETVSPTLVDKGDVLDRLAGIDKAARSLCDQCERFREGKIRKCGGCGVAQYCCEGCQYMAWHMGHRDVCRDLRDSAQQQQDRGKMEKRASV